jgi:hypothetical protein
MDRETASLREIDRLQKEFLDHQKQYDDMNSSSGADFSSEMSSMTAGDSSTSSIASSNKTLGARESQVRHCSINCHIFIELTRFVVLSFLGCSLK